MISFVHWKAAEFSRDRSAVGSSMCLYTLLFYLCFSLDVIYPFSKNIYNDWTTTASAVSWSPPFFFLRINNNQSGQYPKLALWVPQTAKECECVHDRRLCV
jgi:hypothetical protein